MKTKRWYLIQCKSRQELRAKDNLERQGGTCLNFPRTIEKIVAGTIRQVQESLFPGYLFIQLADLDPLWSTIRSTYGVLRMVSFGGRPLAVEEDVVQALLRLSTEQVITARFESGQHVTITQGPFQGLQAIFSEYDGETRAMLLIKFLQKEQCIKLPLADLA